MSRSLIRSAAILVVLIQVTAFSLQAQNPPEDPQRKWAMVIGVSHYTHAEPLRYAASDARAFADFLSSPRGGGIPADHIVNLLEDEASRLGVLVELEAMQERVEEGDTVYVFVAGHGYVTRRGLGYFVPSDGDLRVPAATSVSFSSLKELVEIGLAHAGRRIVVTDLCNAGRIGPERSELAEKIQNLINGELIKLKGEGGPFLNLLASRPSESSWERDDLNGGVFTHVLLKALNGEAKPAEGEVLRAGDLVRYVLEEVPKLTANQQHPMTNEDYDPQLPLAFLSLPGPGQQAEKEPTVLVITNAGLTSYVRLEWIDQQSGSKAIRQLTEEDGALEIGDLQEGELQLSLVDRDGGVRSVIVRLGPGTNTIDLSDPEQLRDLGNIRSEVQQFASSNPLSLIPALQGVAVRPARPSVLGDSSQQARLLIRVAEGTEVYVDDSFFGSADQTSDLLQLEGLNPGITHLRLVESALREYRFRIRLFPGSQVLDVKSGQLTALSRSRRPPTLESLPPGLSGETRESLQRLNQAVWQQHLVFPEGESAWDVYIGIRDQLDGGLLKQVERRLAVAMGNQAQRTILRYLEGADIRWNAGVFEEGALLLERLQSIFKETPAFQSQQHFFIGRSLIEEGDFEGALAELQLAINLDPEASHAYNAIGLALWKQNRLDEAVPPILQALELSPEWTYPRNTLALIRLEQRDYAASEALFSESVTINPEDSTAYHGLGQLYLLQGELGRAEASLLSAVEVNPGNAYAYASLARLYQRQMRWEEAEEALNLAIRLEPDEPAFRIDLAEFLRGQNRLAEGNAVFDVLLRNNTGPQVQQAWADFLARSGRRDEAIQVLEEVVSRLPEDAVPLVRLGLLRLEKDPDGAAREFRRAIKLDSENPFAHYGLAVVRAGKGQLTDALRSLKRAIESDPKYVAPRFLLGRILAAREEFKEGLKELRLAKELAIEPQQEREIADEIARTLDKLVKQELVEVERAIGKGRYAKAWSSLAEILKEVPDHRLLRDAVLDFHDRFPTRVELRLLPKCRLADVLMTDFWKQQSSAEELWRSRKNPDAIGEFAEALTSIRPVELRLVAGTWLNIANPLYSIHEMVSRWALRAVEAGSYLESKKIVDAAVSKRILGQVPDYEPVTVDSLMIPDEGSPPVAFSDFEIAHHPDRRAHEAYCLAFAGLGKMDQVKTYLEALEVTGPDLRLRIRIAEVLNREHHLSDAITLLSPGSRFLKDEVGAQLGETYCLFLADLYLENGDEAAGLQLLQDGQRMIPGSKKIKQKLKELKKRVRGR